MGTLLVVFGMLRFILFSGQVNQLMGFSGILAGLSYFVLGIGLIYAERVKQTLLMIGSLFILTILVTIFPLLIFGSFNNSSTFLTYLAVLAYESYKAYPLLDKYRSIRK